MFHDATKFRLSSLNKTCVYTVGRPPIHGPELHPGSDTPEVEPDKR